jgi:hypothetical protein
MRILKQSIIGLILIIGLTVQVSDVHAIYSSTISNRVSIIKQHVLSARRQNGTGTLLSAWEHLAEQDKNNRDQGKATSFPADASVAIGKVFGYMFYETMRAPLDSIFMVFNLVSASTLPVMNLYPDTLISDCLRNDIWTLQDMRDVVAQEMIKAYLMADEHNGDLLMDDYDYLTTNIDLLKKYGSHPTEELPYYIEVKENGASITRRMESSEYFFGHISDVNYYSFQFLSEERSGVNEDTCKQTCNSNCAKQYDCVTEDYCTNRCDSEYTKSAEVNECKDRCEEDCSNQEDCTDRCEDGCAEDVTIKWVGCPESDLFGAINQVWESMQNLGTIGTFQAADWGSIWEMAKARAKQRADQWIKANQITLTIGGEKGGNPQSLIKGGGLNRFVGSINTQINILKNMIGPAIPLFTWDIYKSSGEQGEEASYGCMYYHREEGVYRACTINQLLDYLNCRENKSETEETGINCDLYKNPAKNKVALDIVDEYRETEDRQIKTLKRAKTAFIYHTELNSVGENNIEAIEKILSGINAEIRYTYEEAGGNGVKPLPTIYDILGAFAKKHGGGK